MRSSLAIQSILTAILTLVLLTVGIRGHMRDYENAQALIPKEEVLGVLITEDDGGLINPDGMTIDSRIKAPEGYRRDAVLAGSFADFLREYPLYPDGTPIRLYDGRRRYGNTWHTAIFAMDVMERDFQQCADSVIRIYAEYLYATGQYDRIRFHFTSGFLCDYDHWRSGHRLSMKNDIASWTYYPEKVAESATEESFLAYLQWVFVYAGTISMSEECVPVTMDDLSIGDVFLEAGDPGHVCLIVDVCRDENGKKAFLLAQGHMPAQSFHIMSNPRHEDDPWYYEDEVTWPFATTEHVFPEGSLMRPPYVTH